MSTVLRGISFFKSPRKKRKQLSVVICDQVCLGPPPEPPALPRRALGREPPRHCDKAEQGHSNKFLAWHKQPKQHHHRASSPYSCSNSSSYGSSTSSATPTAPATPSRVATALLLLLFDLEVAFQQSKKTNIGLPRCQFMN